MSKMTVPIEETEKGSKYNEIEFVEFLEMIVRVAYLKFQGSELEHSITLNQKVEYLLDDLLTIVGLKRNDVQVQESEYESAETSDDY